VLERLIEYWLDSAGERGYQPAFVQMLIGDGHRVLHSSRHSPIEFGKDVISVAPDSVPCAYQLKGNPGGRLTLVQFREIQPQLQGLVTQAIAFPGVPNVQHRSYLITNGYVEEEVQVAIRQMNQTWERQGYGANALTVLARGDLLERAQSLGAALWPFGVANLGALVELLSHPGNDILPLSKVDTLLSAMYHLAEEGKVATEPELTRLVTSAALLMSVSLRNFDNKENHFATISAWVLFVAYTIAACERAGFSPTEKIEGSITGARLAIFDALTALSSETVGRKHLTEGQGLADGEFYHARVALLNGLLSTYWLWCRRENLKPAVLAQVEQFLPLAPASRSLWGEGVLPQLLAHYWCTSRRSPYRKTESILTSLLGAIVEAQLGREGSPLASPYYGISDVVRHRLMTMLGTLDDPFEDESFANASYCAEGLIHLMVRANLKQDCKTLWSDYTRLNHRWFEVSEPWQFCTLSSANGLNVNKVVPNAGQWTSLQVEASRCETPKVPARLRADPVLLLMLVIVMPQRATPDVVRFLGSVFSDVWFLPQPPPAP
jgi:hypothetical protein